MENLIESIRSALNPEASDDTREAGVVACRMILMALEAKPGEPLAAPVASSAAPNAMPQLAGIVGALRGMPPDQLLDLAIARLRAALPADATLPAVTPLKFQLVPVLGKGTSR